MRDTTTAELRRIERDPAYRARFRALLDAALAQRTAQRETAQREAEYEAVAWTCCLALEPALATAVGGIA